TIAPVPDSLEARALGLASWGHDTLWSKLQRGASIQRIPVRSAPDHPMITGIRFPTLNAMRRGTPTLFAVKIAGRSRGADTTSEGPTALIQVTDLGVHAKIG